MTKHWESGGLEPVRARDHVRGPEDTPVTLVKYGDYECPYCGQLHPVLKELQERAGERVRFIFRHFPLDSEHPRARRETVHSSVRRADVDEGVVDGVSSNERQKIKDLQRENRELRRAKEILKAASVFFAAELDPRPKS
jgi:transposase-like protein